ncbi:MAG: hypothetical protein IT328_13295 [Caldilineaceae bacterium]|nr:hypothetical protein [Caldilineaceae bacterium]
MRWILFVLGILMVLMGGIWALQGANLLLGSPMTGDPFWLVVGIVVIVVGAALSFFAWRWRNG